MRLQHGGRKLVETSGSLKTFLLSVKLENICIGASLNILVTQAYRYFRARNMSPKNNADLSRTVKNRVLVSNQSSLPS